MENLTFGQRLVYFRKRAMLLQKELAEQAEITPTALNYYEKDKREPNVLTIKKLASILGVSGDELLGVNILYSSIKAQGDTEIALLHAFRGLNKEGQEKVSEYIDDIVRSGKYIKK